MIEVPYLKPAVKTFEGWVATFVAIGGLGLIGNVISQQETDTFLKALESLVGAVTTIISISLLVFQRLQLKKEQLRQAVYVAPVNDAPPVSATLQQAAQQTGGPIVSGAPITYAR